MLSGWDRQHLHPWRINTLAGFLLEELFENSSSKGERDMMSCRHNAKWVPTPQLVIPTAGYKRMFVRIEVVIQSVAAWLIPSYELILCRKCEKTLCKPRTLESTTTQVFRRKDSLHLGPQPY